MPNWTRSTGSTTMELVLGGHTMDLVINPIVGYKRQPPRYGHGMD